MRLYFFAEINECLQFDACPHYCVNTKGSYKCSCDRNFKEINGNCVARGMLIKLSVSTVVTSLWTRVVLMNGFTF